MSPGRAADLQPQHISLYRYGGEEFAVIFPVSIWLMRIPLLEQWRINVANRDWREEGLNVTFSAGLASGKWSRWSNWLIALMRRFTGRNSRAKPNRVAQ
jgi:GGDEF domain-containing protein